MPEITLPGGISVAVGTTKPDWPTFCQDHSIKKELKLLVVKSPDNSADAWQKLADKLTEQVTSEYGVDPKINYRYIQLDSVNIIVFTALYTRYQQYSTVDGETKKSINPEFKQFVKDMGTTIKTCKTRKPMTKRKSRISK